MKNIGQEVTVCGWLQYQRMGGAFLIIRDWTGTVQTVLSEEVQLKFKFRYFMKSLIFNVILIIYSGSCLFIFVKPVDV